MDYFIVAFALLFILAITFAFGMRDLFPTRYKAFVNAQQREWSHMTVVPFPRVQKALWIVQLIGWVSAGLLLFSFCVGKVKHSPSWLAFANDLCLNGLGFIFFALTLAKTFVFIKGNAKSSRELDRSSNWTLLVMYFVTMNLLLTYWL